MNESYVEVKAKKADKVIGAIFLLPVCLGSFCIASVPLYLLGVPIFGGKPPSLFDFVFLFVGGIAFLVWGIIAWRIAVCFVIRADEQGIFETDGWRRHHAAWSEVSNYYLQAHNATSKRNSFLPPVLLDADGEILFRFFNKQMRQDEVSYAERQQLYIFVEAQLAGKKIEAPVSMVDAEEAVVKSIEVNWKEKSVWWKVGRVAALLTYGLFWLGLSLFLMYWTMIGKVSVPKEWDALFMFPIILGPVLPHFIWLHFKKKKVLRELKMREVEK